MIAALKRIFAAPETKSSQDQLRLAGALMLMEVAFADFDLGAAERELLQAQLAARFCLSGEDLERLLEHALKQHDLHVSLHEQVALINQHYDAAAKRELIRDMWDIAYADGKLHHYEEAVIRRLADLLYVPHRDFIQTKHEVTGET
jgi:uncharacterized tellurite resistance protein B-like protein